MLISYILIILLLLVLCFTPFICALRQKEYRNKFFSVFKKKKNWIVISIIILFPFVIYTVITIILINVRGDCFAGYYISGQSTVIYQENVYYRITDEDKIEEVDKQEWLFTDTLIAYDVVQFPYFAYWIPDMFYGHLILVEDDTYIVVETLGGNMYYKQ